MTFEQTNKKNVYCMTGSNKEIEQFFQNKNYLRITDCECDYYNENCHSDFFTEQELYHDEDLKANIFEWYTDKFDDDWSLDEYEQEFKKFQITEKMLLNYGYYKFSDLSDDDDFIIAKKMRKLIIFTNKEYL